MRRFIDTHTHILPQIDDGSESITESRAMIEALNSLSVQEVWLTPHFYPRQDSVGSFLSRRGESLRSIRTYLDAAGFTYRVGAEVRLSESLFNLNSLEPLTVSGTKYLLLELPWRNVDPTDLLNMTGDLVNHFDVQVIIAHIERYKFFSNRNILAEFLSLGVDLQLTLAYQDLTFLKKRAFVSYIKDGLVKHFGSDTHNMTTRPPYPHSYFEKLEDHLSS